MRKLKDWDVTLIVTHVQAPTADEAIAKAKADSRAVYNSIGEATEIKD